MADRAENKKTSPDREVVCAFLCLGKTAGPANYTRYGLLLSSTSSVRTEEIRLCVMSKFDMPANRQCRLANERGLNNGAVVARHTQLTSCKEGRLIDDTAHAAG